MSRRLICTSAQLIIGFLVGGLLWARDEVRVAVIVPALPSLYGEFHGKDDAAKPSMQEGCYSFEGKQVLIGKNNNLESQIFLEKFGTVDRWLALNGNRVFPAAEREDMAEQYRKLVVKIEEAVQAYKKQVAIAAAGSSNGQALKLAKNELEKVYAFYVTSFQHSVLLVYAKLFAKLNDGKKESTRYTLLPFVWPSRLLGFIDSRADVKADLEMMGGSKKFTQGQKHFVRIFDEWVKKNKIAIVDFNILLNQKAIYAPLKKHKKMIGSTTKEQLNALAEHFIAINQKIFEMLAEANPDVFFVHNSGFTLPEGKNHLKEGWQVKARANVISTLALETAKIQDNCGVFVRPSSNIGADIAMPGFFRYSHMKENGTEIVIPLKTPGIANALLVSMLAPAISRKDGEPMSEVLEYVYKQSERYYALKGKVERERGCLRVGNVPIATINPRYPEAFIERSKKEIEEKESAADSGNSDPTSGG